MLLSDYVEVFRRRWWIVLLATVVAAGSGFAFTKVVARYWPVYRSEASYLVTSNRVDNGLQIVLQNRMNSFKSVALAPVQLEKISAQLRLDRSADWLLDKHVAIQARPDEQMMVVQVDYPDPAVAPALADAVGENMVALVNAQNDGIEGTDRINLRVNQPARPAFLQWPRANVIVPAGALLGMLLGLILAFVLEALDDTLKTPTDVERFAGLATLAAIPGTGERAAGGAGARIWRRAGQRSASAP